MFLLLVCVTLLTLSGIFWSIPASISHSNSSTAIVPKLQRRFSGTDVASIRSLLNESYASNGYEGFFIEQPGSIKNSMSLYDTSWWLQLSNTPHLVNTKLLHSWVAPLLYGAGSG